MSRSLRPQAFAHRFTASSKRYERLAMTMFHVFRKLSHRPLHKRKMFRHSSSSVSIKFLHSFNAWMGTCITFHDPELYRNCRYFDYARDHFFRGDARKAAAKAGAAPAVADDAGEGSVRIKVKLR